MRGLLFDAKFALRNVLRAPTFAVTVTFTVALGITACAAIFAVVNAVLLRPLPYESPNELVMIWEVDRHGLSGEPGTEWTVSPANYVAWRDRAQAFDDIAAFNYWVPTLSGDGPAEPILGSVVTPNILNVLGVTPALGSGFGPEHAVPGGERVVIIAHGLWQRRFGGDPTIIGRTIRLNGTAHTVIGVMPEGYRHPEPRHLAAAEIWRPIAWSDPASQFGRHLRTVARLKLDVSLEAGKAEMAAIMRQLELDYPAEDAGWGVAVRPLREQLFGDVRGPLLLLLGAAGFVLLIVCANVANLVLARGHSRRRELAIRASLGSGRGRLLRGLLVENVLLTGAGSAIGLLAVWGGLDTLRAVQTRYISSVADIRVDATVIVFTAALALLTGVLFGLLPVFQSLVVTELVFATVLAVGAGLMARSFAALVSVPTGFASSRVLTFDLVLPAEPYETPQSRRAYYEELLARLRGLPGVRGAGQVSDLPFTTENRFLDARRMDDPRPPDQWSMVEYRKVGPGYFEALGIALLSGRDFDPTDGVGEGDVPVIVNRALAARWWPERQAIGERFHVAEYPELVRVVGVVADILDDGYDGAVEPRFYVPYSYNPSRYTAAVLAAAVHPTSLIPAIRSEAAALEPEAPVTSFRLLDDMVAESVADERIALTLASAFSLLALLLAAVGIYGLMAYAVGQRRREIGIRGALGAKPADIMRLVMGQSARLTISGTAVGLGLSLPLGRLLSAFLFRIGPTDLVALGIAPLVLASAALLAAYVPAARATRIQPVEALRRQR